jgi:hypothetical protein
MNFSNRSNNPHQAVLDSGFATVTVVLSLSFLFIFAEYLKNHSKS